MSPGLSGQLSHPSALRAKIQNLRSGLHLDLDSTVQGHLVQVLQPIDLQPHKAQFVTPTSSMANAQRTSTLSPLLP